MKTQSASPTATPFFLKMARGERFCLFHAPAGACVGAILYVHPFGDEMNKARRMAALQSRQLAAQGYGVLQMDLYGCGDSSGEFSDARWDIWKADLAAGAAWLDDQLGRPLSLWGLRLGALLALDYANDAPQAVDRLVLWQPVQNGATYLKQVLRLLTAKEMMSENPAKASSSAALRTTLLNGQMLEVGGYEIAPELAAAIDRLEAVQLAPTDCPVEWFETVASLDRPETPAMVRLAHAWTQRGVTLRLHRLASPPFWSTQEIAESTDLLAATSAVFPGLSHELSRART